MASKYTAQWLVHGVLFANPFINLDLYPARSVREENIPVEAAADILADKVKKIAEKGHYNLEAGGGWHYKWRDEWPDLKGIKSGVMQVPFNGNSFTAQFFMRNITLSKHQRHDGWDWNVPYSTSLLFAELKRDAEIQITEAQSYFKKTTEMAETWVGDIAREYCRSWESQFLFPLYFRCLGMSGSNILRNLFLVSHDPTLTEDESKHLMDEHNELKLVKEELADIHEINKNAGKYKRRIGQFRTHNVFHFYVHIESLLESSMIWTGITDLQYANEISDLFRNRHVEDVETCTYFGRSLDLSKRLLDGTKTQ